MKVTSRMVCPLTSVASVPKDSGATYFRLKAPYTSRLQPRMRISMPSQYLRKRFILAISACLGMSNVPRKSMMMFSLTENSAMRPLHEQFEMILALCCKISPVLGDFFGTLAVGEHCILASFISMMDSGGNTIDLPFEASFQICAHTSLMCILADGLRGVLCLFGGL